MRRRLALLFVLTACGSAGVPSTAPTTTVATEPGSEIVVPRQIEDLGVVRLDLDDRELLLAVADEPVERTTGLMFITDLDDLDGMVFVYRSDTTVTFHMENTLIPLDIAFFGADGSFVSKTTMEPCEVADCPRYRAEGRYRYAIEVPAGDFDWVDSTTGLDVDPLTS
jgi:uncharacterized membrane protein (UPF0127 family)